MNNPIKRDKIDDTVEIAKAANANFFGLSDICENQDFKAVQQFLDEFKKKFVTLDGIWTAFVANDQQELKHRSAILAGIRERLFELERNISYIGRPQFNWDKTLMAMAWLLAYFEASTQTIEFNERLAKIKNPESVT